MNTLRRCMPWKRTETSDVEPLLTREWLVTNGLGGYAAGTVSGVPTRRYHGLLIAALPAPLGRTMMLSHLLEQFRLADGTLVRLSGAEHSAGAFQLEGAKYLGEFCLEEGLPRWRYEIGGVVLEKRLLMLHGQNTVHVTYRLLSDHEPIRLKLLPLVHFRSHDATVDQPLSISHCLLTARAERYELATDAEFPPLRLRLFGQHQAFTVEGREITEVFFRREKNRGYPATGSLWTPGYFRADVHRGQDATLVASTEPWETVHALFPEQALQAEHERRQRLLYAAHPAARTDIAAELVLAADQFIIKPAGRVEDAARAHASGDEVRTIIAGYHWFTDWGRDTMISLEGLTLMTGRHAEAREILRTFANYLRDGLIPNMFPEGEKEGLYHTADATLWFFHTLDRYLTITDDRTIVQSLLPKLLSIVTHHVQRTHFGIGVDAKDGLLRQGQAGYQLTWMDAKVGDWVVTPRRGKAVEINALWYNALRLLVDWAQQEGQPKAAESLAQHAERAYNAFNERFWYASGGYLYDIVDGEEGDDPACRPNQLLAMSLRHPILAPERWSAVLDIVQQQLLTPVGLRSLAPTHAAYKPQYNGDLRARDAAYHQGTVWAWLIGPFIDAWLKVHPQDYAGAQCFLAGFKAHLGEACIGSISEIFDAEKPYIPRGCVAQAWSVAEVLRAWVKTTHPLSQYEAPSP